MNEFTETILSNVLKHVNPNDNPEQFCLMDEQFFLIRMNGTTAATEFIHGRFDRHVQCEDWLMSVVNSDVAAFYWFQYFHGTPPENDSFDGWKFSRMFAKNGFCEPIHTPLEYYSKRPYEQYMITKGKSCLRVMQYWDELNKKMTGWRLEPVWRDYGDSETYECFRDEHDGSAGTIISYE